MKIVLFHHIFCPGGDMSGGWKFLLAEQFDTLEQSGLVEACGGVVNIGVIASTKDRLELARRIAENYPWAKVIHWVNHDPDDNGNDDWYEGATLKPLWDYCRALHANPGAEREVVYYTHSKGALTENKCVRQWRGMMTHFVVERWRDAAQYIEEGADLAGCNLTNNGWFHFSGNFWVAASDYIAKLPDPMMDNSKPGGWYCDNTRVRFEMWVASGMASGLNPRVVELHNSGLDNHYLQPYPRKRYAPTRFQLTPDEEAWLRERYTRKAG